MQSEKRKKQKSDYYHNVFKPRGLQRVYDLVRRYGITKEQYDEMYLSQHGNCAICGDHKNVLCVDHNHNNNVVRGLLCANCNKAIGLLKDDKSILEKAIQYLSK